MVVIAVHIGSYACWDPDSVGLAVAVRVSVSAAAPIGESVAVRVDIREHWDTVLLDS